MSNILPMPGTYTTYRLYREDDGSIAIVTLPGGDESQHDAARFVSKPFYTADGIELALYGYKLLHGEILTSNERHRLTMLLIGGNQRSITSSAM